MKTMSRRLLQVGCIVLALTMLGIYVVRSQQAKQPGQVAPSSKRMPLSDAFVPTASGTNLLGSNGVGYFQLPPGQTIMYSTKAAPVIKLESPLQFYDPGSNRLTLFHSPPGQLMMGSTKVTTVFKAESFQLKQDSPLPAAGSAFQHNLGDPTNQFTSTNRISRTLMPGSKSTGLELLHVDEKITESIDKHVKRFESQLATNAQAASNAISTGAAATNKLPQNLKPVK